MVVLDLWGFWFCGCSGFMGVLDLWVFWICGCSGFVGVLMGVLDLSGSGFMGVVLLYSGSHLMER